MMKDQQFALNIASNSNLEDNPSTHISEHGGPTFVPHHLMDHQKQVNMFNHPILSQQRQPSAVAVYPPNLLVRGEINKMRFRRPVSAVRRNTNNYSTMRPTSAQVLVVQTNNFMGNYNAQPGNSNNQPQHQQPHSVSAPRTRRHLNAPNMSLFELQEDLKGVKQEKKLKSRENTMLHNQIKNLERELLRKDQVIKQLIDSNNTISLQRLESANTATSDNQLSLKQKLKQLKGELLGKNEELQNLQRTLKYTQLKELEFKLIQSEQENLQLLEIAAQAQSNALNNQEYHKLQHQLNLLEITLQGMYVERAQLTALISQKEEVNRAQNFKITKITEKVTQLKEKNVQNAKKIKLLTTKIMEMSKTQNIKSLRPSNSVETKSLSPQNHHQERSKKLILKQHGSSNSIGSATQKITRRDSSKSEADLFEKYVIEKTKNERLLANLERLGIKVDVNELFKNVPITTSNTTTAAVNSVVASNLTSAAKDPINIKVFDKKQKDQNPLIIKELKLKLQIKRIPPAHSSHYLTQNLKSPVSKAAFTHQLITLIQMNADTANKTCQLLFESEAIHKDALQAKLAKLIGTYEPYSGIEITQKLNDLVEYVSLGHSSNEEAKEKIYKKFEKADSAKSGKLLLTKVQQIFVKELKLPQMNSSLKDFFEYLVFRQCDSLTDMAYAQFLEILDENYLIEESPYEDVNDGVFQIESRQSSLKQSSNIESPNQQADERNQNAENELMIFMDAVMSKLCSKFTKNQIISQQDQRSIISGIEQTIGPYLTQQKVDDQVIVILTIADMFRYLNEGLGMNVREHEMEYIAHIIGREDGGIIIFQEFMEIINNFLFKEYLFTLSIKEGIRYDQISDPKTFEYLSSLRSLIANGEKSLRSLFPEGFIQKQPVKTQSATQVIDIIELPLMILYLHETFSLPNLANEQAMKDLRTLFSVDPTKYPDILLFNKMERIIARDFDHIYINLLQLTRANHRAQYVMKYQPKQASSPLHGNNGGGVPSDIEELEEELESNQSQQEQTQDTAIGGGIKSQKRPRMTGTPSIRDNNNSSQRNANMVDDEDSQLQPEYLDEVVEEEVIDQVEAIEKQQEQLKKKEEIAEEIEDDYEF